MQKTIVVELSITEAISLVGALDFLIKDIKSQNKEIKSSRTKISKVIMEVKVPKI